MLPAAPGPHTCCPARLAAPGRSHVTRRMIYSGTVDTHPLSQPTPVCRRRPKGAQQGCKPHIAWAAGVPCQRYREGKLKGRERVGESVCVGGATHLHSGRMLALRCLQLCPHEQLVRLRPLQPRPSRSQRRLQVSHTLSPARPVAHAYGCYQNLWFGHYSGERRYRWLWVSWSRCATRWALQPPATCGACVECIGKHSAESKNVECRLLCRV